MKESSDGIVRFLEKPVDFDPATVSRPARVEIIESLCPGRSEYE